MAGLVSNLIDVLKGQIELFQQINALSVDKKQYIIKNDTESLRAVVAKENEIVPKALRADKNRQLIMKDICTVLNKKEEDMTLTHLISLIEGQPDHKELAEVVGELKSVADEMKELNDSIKVLLENALEFIDFNINMIHSSFSEAPAGYGDTLEEAPQKSFLDING